MVLHKLRGTRRYFVPTPGRGWSECYFYKPEVPGIWALRIASLSNGNALLDMASLAMRV